MAERILDPVNNQRGEALVVTEEGAVYDMQQNGTFQNEGKPEVSRESDFDDLPDLLKYDRAGIR